MKYGKIRIEDGYLIFTKHMMINSLPCRDILWAYLRREGNEGEEGRQIISNSLVIVTRRRKRYKFEMTEKEVHECLALLRALNPEMAVGFPRGGRIPLQSLSNTRDLGAISAKDGRHILPRKLLRSGQLYHMSLADQDVLCKEYHLSAVIDFRNDYERKKRPDLIPEGVIYHSIPIIDEESVSNEEKNWTAVDAVLNFEGDPDEFMVRQYQNLITDQYSVKMYARFLDVLLRQEEGAVLWHCSTGKDRTGVGTALLLCALGVSREDIMEDYMKSNACLEDEMEYIIRLMETKTIVDPGIMDRIGILFRVREEYLDAVFETIEEKYGSVERFLRKALYLTPKAIEALQNKYLV
ncbi:tyrosine-protein phosphatase [Blautia sp. HCP3S3_G3]|uniref:tyrosine-protein phosphatase n=1 Tax=Blautia sp. HCP3S3_G3 TaxID=3438913 RepID=UPI003F89AFD0